MNTYQPARYGTEIMRSGDRTVKMYFRGSLEHPDMTQLIFMDSMMPDFGYVADFEIPTEAFWGMLEWFKMLGEHKINEQKPFNPEVAPYVP